MAKRCHPNKPAKRVTGASTDGPLIRDETALVQASPKKRRLDILKGKFTVPPEFFDPLPEEELDAWER